MEVQDQKILVIGMARSGIAAAKTLAAMGAEVTLADSKPQKELKEAIIQIEDWPVKVVAGGYPEVIPANFDLLVTSPGVPAWVVPLQQAVRNKIPVLSEIELAYRLAASPMIAVTGTNGKTTTTALIGQMFQDSGLAVIVAGNIGIPLIQEVTQASPQHVLVVEVSSFQLEWVKEFHPKVAVITNLTPDHMDRHGSMEGYLAVKARIFRKQTLKDFTIINYDDLSLRELDKTSPGQVIFFSRQHKLEKGICVIDGKICIINSGNRQAICSITDVAIPGAHNLENALAAVAAGWAMGLAAEQMAYSLRNFPGVPHRLEKVALIKEVQYINDSKGTNPEASLKALEAFEQPLILIAGGSSKGSDFSLFARKITEKVRELILVGETAGEISQAVMANSYQNIHLANTLDEAVLLAHRLAQPGDVVLLSPACASFDFFKNYEHRGDVFKSLVTRLAE